MITRMRRIEAIGPTMRNGSPLNTPDRIDKHEDEQEAIDGFDKTRCIPETGMEAQSVPAALNSARSATAGKAPSAA